MNNNQVIDWLLYDNEKLVVCHNNKNCFYEKNRCLIYISDNEENNLDFEKNKFIRKTPEMEMVIDISKETCKFDFQENGTCEVDIHCKLIQNNEKIELTYNLDEEIKKLLIIIK